MQPKNVPEEVVLGMRDRVPVTGGDATSFLQSQLSQDIGPLSDGATTWTYVLSPAGKVVSLARVTRIDANHYVLDTDAGFGESLAARLHQFKIRVDVEITVEAAPTPLPTEPDAKSDSDSERRRIQMGWPRMGAEIIGGETIPAGLGLNHLAVSFTKGCYPGQELVERMDSRGAEAPRVLGVVEVPIGTRPGDTVTDGEGNDIGTVTSVIDGVALAWVRRATQ